MAQFQSCAPQLSIGESLSRQQNRLSSSTKYTYSIKCMQFTKMNELTCI